MARVFLKKEKAKGAWLFMRDNNTGKNLPADDTLEGLLRKIRLGEEKERPRTKRQKCELKPEVHPRNENHTGSVK